MPPKSARDEGQRVVGGPALEHDTAGDAPGGPSENAAADAGAGGGM